ncbi:MAG: hypothetical protein V2A61_04800, partial [Calditrichota bacterium]
EDCLDQPFEDIKIQMDLVTSIPLKGVVRLLAGNDPNMMDTMLAVDLPRGEIFNHRVQPTSASMTKFLTTSDLEIFNRLPLFTQQIISLESTYGDTVWMHSQDSVAVKVNLEGHILVDIEKYTEE